MTEQRFNEVVRVEQRDECALILVDNPPVNGLSFAVRDGVCQALAGLLADDRVRAIVLACDGRTFFAGADIREFGQPPKEPILPQMLEALDASTKLTVAAIHGTALGGGFETALCCHYRIALPSAKVGLPEVKLGLLPGAGGTQRLPRLLGVTGALDAMVSGNPLGAPQALATGLLDRLVEADDPRDVSALHTAAVAYAKQLLADDAPLRRVRDMPVPTPDAGEFEAFEKKMARKTRGYTAPARIVQAVQASTQLNFEAGLRKERELFLECQADPQSKAMQHMFFAERQVAKIPGLVVAAKPAPVQHVGIIGAGTMGSGIALACLAGGLQVVLLDSDDAGLARGKAHINKQLEANVAKGRMNAEQADAQRARLSLSLDYDSLSQVDMVIEAVFESMAIKQQVFSRLDQVCKADAILATNTSTLDVDAIANATKRPHSVIGLHFFSPANIMKLLEIVRGQASSDEIIARSMAFAKQIRKIGVLVGNCFGFVGNRMLYGYGRENQFMLLEGASPQQIDAALYAFGMAMGPNAVGDLAGLDVGYKVRQERTDLPDDPRYYRVATALAEMGRYGQKTGKGTYLYEAGSRAPVPDPEVDALIQREAAALGIEARPFEAEEIVQRCIYALVLEGARILEEGIAIRASDIDVIWANGYGFPRFQGGPMRYADSVGLKQVVASIEGFDRSHDGDYWRMSALLKRLAEEGGALATYQSA